MEGGSNVVPIRPGIRDIPPARLLDVQAKTLALMDRVVKASHEEGVAHGRRLGVNSMVPWMFLAACLGFFMGFAITARAAELPDTRATLAQVNAILGTDVRDAPAIELVDALPRGAWGAYADGRVQISREAPAACRDLIAGHEMSHHVAIQAGLLRDVPTDAAALKAALEVVARRVEAAWSPYSPNCMGHRSWQ